MSALQSIRKGLEDVCSGIAPGAHPRITLIPTSDEDWLESWREHFHAFACGGAFRIRPPWESRAEDGLVDLVIDPGMAFGTGQHPTTEMMLEVLSQHRPEGRAVLDVGAGSAILSIAAALLGARSVLAVEVDPSAESNARRNIALNGAEDVVEYQLADASGVEGGPYDIVLMTLWATPSSVSLIAGGPWAPDAMFASPGSSKRAGESVAACAAWVCASGGETNAEWPRCDCDLA